MDCPLLRFGVGAWRKVHYDCFALSCGHIKVALGQRVHGEPEKSLNALDKVPIARFVLINSHCGIDMKGS